MMETNTFDLPNAIPLVVEAAKKAGKAIMQIYLSDDFEVQLKSDQSPLTKADQKAHQIIAECLLPLGIPILSEEGKQIDYSERKKWNLFWMVDPLDGTKEFIKRNGEFTVNIALIENNQTVWGLVFAPVLNKLYYVDANNQVVLVENEKTIVLQKKSIALDLHKKGIQVVASRSHLDENTSKMINQFNEPQLLSMGSSLKFMLLAEGKADIYPRFAPTMEWDTAAAHAILKKLNYQILQENKPVELAYNKENLLNPGFIAS